MCENKVPVLDTAALITKIILQIPTKQYTVAEVLDEVRDEESRKALRIALEAGKLSIVKPSEESLRKVREVARKIGELANLSKTDLAVASLALDLKNRGLEPVIYTDDYSLQNLAKSLGITFHPIRTRGIVGKRKYMVYCPACGYVASSENEKICPRCGHRLSRKPIS